MRNRTLYFIKCDCQFTVHISFLLNERIAEYSHMPVRPMRCTFHNRILLRRRHSQDRSHYFLHPSPMHTSLWLVPMMADRNNNYFHSIQDFYTFDLRGMFHLQGRVDWADPYFAKHRWSMVSKWSPETKQTMQRVPMQYGNYIASDPQHPHTTGMFVPQDRFHSYTHQWPQ